MAQYDLNSEQHIERLEGFLLRLKDHLNNTITLVKDGQNNKVVEILEDVVKRIDTLKQG